MFDLVWSGSFWLRPRSSVSFLTCITWVGLGLVWFGLARLGSVWLGPPSVGSLVGVDAQWVDLVLFGLSSG